MTQPKAGAGQLLVRVKAAGVGNWDALIREGKVELQSLPIYPRFRAIDSGKLVTHVGTVLPLEDARIAHEMLAGRPHRRGKIMLDIDSRP